MAIITEAAQLPQAALSRTAQLRSSTGSVLVTGAGGPCGVAIIDALVGRRQVIAADSNPQAAGFFLCDHSVVLPKADDPGFVDQLLHAAHEYRIGTVVSTISDEIAVLADNRARLTKAGIFHWLPSRDAAETCIDKYRFSQVLGSHRVPKPATAIGDRNLRFTEEVTGPWVVKPRFGRGSRDVFTVSDREDLPTILKLVPDPIVQHRVVGNEFTVDGLAGTGGKVLGSVARWRLETRGGISTVGETFVNPVVDVAVAQTLDAIELEGPFTLQGFVTASGAVLVIEVNPRFSGGLPLSLASGADLVGGYLLGAEGGVVDPELLVGRAGVRMIRRFSEFYTYPNRRWPVITGGAALP